MGWRGFSVVLRVSALAVLAPFGVFVLAAAGVSTAAVRMHAALLHGDWAWLGATALLFDLLAALAFCGLPAAARWERASRAAMGDVDLMTGEEFEERLGVLFADLGFAVTRTGARGDFGADLLVERDERLVVQAKRYDGTVGIEAVQQVIGATRFYGAAAGLVVTNSTCTPAARELAAAHDVELVERGDLVALLAAHPLDDRRSTGVSLFAREVACGVSLVVYACWRVVCLAWWAVRLALRLPLTLLRTARR